MAGMGCRYGGNNKDRGVDLCRSAIDNRRYSLHGKRSEILVNPGKIQKVLKEYSCI